MTNKGKLGALLLMLCAAGAQAQLYKWVGPDGKVTYSDSPPPPTASKVETKNLGSGGISVVDLPYELAEAVKASPVTLYTAKKDCPPCEDGRKHLAARGVPYREKTVDSEDDVAQFRKAGGEGTLPLLVVGRFKESGFQAQAWNNALTATGYPETSKLPKNYRNPPAEAAAPVAAPAAAPADTARAAKPQPPATELPPATGKAPPGFRF